MAGYPINSMFNQPALERILHEHAAANPLITTCWNQTVSHPERLDGAVRIASYGPTVKHRSVTGRYVVSYDGANSFVQERMGATITDLGYFYDWLVVDVVPDDPTPWTPMNLQVCDPAHPTTMGPGAAASSSCACRMRRPCTPRHDGKVERYQRLLSEECLYARVYESEQARRKAIGVWGHHYNHHRPHAACAD